MIPAPLARAGTAAGDMARRALSLWPGVPGPIRATILISLALLVGELHGAHVERTRCSAEGQASIGRR